MLILRSRSHDDVLPQLIMMKEDSPKDNREGLISMAVSSQKGWENAFGGLEVRRKSDPDGGELEQGD